MKNKQRKKDAVIAKIKKDKKEKDTMEAKKAMTEDEAYSMKSGRLTVPARPSPTGKPVMVKGGGLMEATAKLKAKGMKDGGMVVKEKIVAIDTSPNSGLITTKGFGAGRRT